MENLIKCIQENRGIGERTLKNYFRTYTRLMKLIGVESVESFLNSADGIVLEKIKTYKESTQATMLSAVIVALESYGLKHNVDYSQSLELYRTYLKGLMVKINEAKYSEQKSETEEKNWTTIENLQDCIKKNFKAIKEIIKRDNFSAKDIKLIQNWLIANLYMSGDENPPTRLDWGECYIVSKDEYEFNNDKTKNYLIIQSSRTKYFILNNYKTSKKYGSKSIKLGPTLNKAINLYMKVNKKIKGNIDNLLLFNNKFEPLSDSLMSNYVTDAFASSGKHVTCNLLRHIYITEVVSKMTLAERKKTSDKMCHSLELQLVYNKSDSD